MPFPVLCLFLFLVHFIQPGYVPPAYPGGAKALSNYFVRYADYPSDELALNVSGECLATIYINKSGKVKFVHAIGEHRNFNQEAKRVLTLMPDWRPAKKNGVPIDTFITRKFFFSLEHERAKGDTTVTELVAFFQPATDKKEAARLEKLAKMDLERLQRAPLFDKAVQALRDSQYVDAVHLFNKLQLLGENGQDMYFNKGIAYFRLDELDSACACWQTAARLGDKEALKVFQLKCK
jgi:hypothetical protein